MPTSFQSLKVVNGKCVNTFREAAQLRGLLLNSNDAEECISEAILYQMPATLRHLFAIILVHCAPSNPKLLWDKFQDAMSEDIQRDKTISQHTAHIKILIIIQGHLKSMGKDIISYNLIDMPIQLPDEEQTSKEIDAEKNIVVSAEDLATVTMLNKEQKFAFEKIMEKVDSGKNAAFFINGPGGTGKTFLYRAILITIRSRGNIALATATSGIAASILPGGRTAHSRFKIPITDNEHSTCNISKQSTLSKLIKKAKIILWDEATMAKKHAIESFDNMLRDIMSEDKLFGGKIVVFGGDFRQTLPVIKKGQKSDIISSSMVTSYVWHELQQIKLTENMRAKFDPIFANYLLKIGNGEEPTFEDSRVNIPQELIIPFKDDMSSISTLVDTIFPSFEMFSQSSTTITNRAILTTKNEFVDEINNMLIEKFPGNSTSYMSYDETIDDKKQVENEDLLHSLNPPGLPPHELILKPKAPFGQRFIKRFKHFISTNLVK